MTLSIFNRFYHACIKFTFVLFRLHKMANIIFSFEFLTRSNSSSYPKRAVV